MMVDKDIIRNLECLHEQLLRERQMSSARNVRRLIERFGK